jgi:hypothetical protein
VTVSIRKNPEKAPATDSDESIAKVPPPRPPPPGLAPVHRSSSTQPLLAAADRDDDEGEEDRSEDVVVSNGGGGGGSNGVMEEGDRLITVDLRDESPGTSESGESETRLTEDVTPATGPETEMVDFDGRQKKPLKKRPVLTHQGTASLLYCCREPEQQDRLPPAEIERMTCELVKTLGSLEGNKNPYMSPGLAPDDMLRGLPPVHIIGTSLDPLLDDSVDMARRLQSLGQPVTLNVVENIPHGFLCLKSAGSDQDLEAGQRLCIEYIKQGLGITSNGHP